MTLSSQNTCIIFYWFSKTQILSNEVKCPVACRCRHLATGHSVWILDQSPEAWAATLELYRTSKYTKLNFPRLHDRCLVGRSYRAALDSFFPSGFISTSLFCCHVGCVRSKFESSHHCLLYDHQDEHFSYFCRFIYSGNQN